VKVNVLAPEYPGYGIYNSVNEKNWGLAAANAAKNLDKEKSEII